MKRRDALKTISLISGSAFISSSLFTACQSDAYVPKFFTRQQLTLLDEIGETILPETATSPGAKTQKVANFMDVYVADCYSEANQKILQTGLTAFEEACQTQTGQSFLNLKPTQQKDWLMQLDQKAKDSATVHYFSLLKNLVLLGYFTSKEGAEKALRYVPIPGKYDGDYPFQRGDKAWAIG